MIRSLTLEAPAWNRREIMRYARIRGAEHSYDALIEECIAEAEKALSYRVCYTVLDVTSKDGILTLGDIPAESQTIKKAIGNAERILLFAATVGAQFDRLIHRYSMIVPSKALIFQAIGAERVESLCDAFCAQMTTELNPSQKCLTRRVSPGYGDIPLSMQKDIFAVLDCPRKIGLTLDQSLLMSPSKSVTAITGIVSERAEQHNKCDRCDRKDCAYRK